MSDYRFQVVEHNGILCLHVLIDHAELDKNGEEIIHTHIPLDDIQAAIAKSYTQMIIENFHNFFRVTPDELGELRNKP